MHPALMSDERGYSLYREIADALKAKIAAGDYAPGAPLPSQAKLAEKFGTTIATVRQALQILADGGLIELRHGVGSFVKGLGAEHRAFQLQSFSPDIPNSAVRIQTAVYAREYRVWPAEPVHVFEASDEGVCALSRIRYADHIPVVFQRSYFPMSLSDLIESYDPSISLYTHLSQRLSTVISTAEESIHAVPLPGAIAAILRQQSAVPALHSIRISRSVSGEPVLYDDAYMLGSAVGIELMRRGNNARLQFLVDVAGPDGPTSSEEQL